ncbi:hypothetical protein DYBT9623_00282 [Dyadobacter sp. CECT 9623]|uniref:Uncharacterized protein n=1 Tax=Dyadobacter linearis TaxID=2823330 RepID=A0ABM8UJ95_9BACT|nr:hypothetical protein [Dyadobacter sp. CECT 9623]CAG5067561.1 hypothetical protein DYBT9623_00282 [Dyadobacter sp. CECT 9623]
MRLQKDFLPLFILLSIFHSFSVNAQDSDLEWINKMRSLLLRIQRKTTLRFYLKY